MAKADGEEKGEEALLRQRYIGSWGAAVLGGYSVKAIQVGGS